jgi:hypothetical protein
MNLAKSGRKLTEEKRDIFNIEQELLIQRET